MATKMLSLQSPAAIGLFSTPSRGSCAKNPVFYGQAFNVPCSKKYPNARKLRSLGISVQASVGPSNISSKAIEAIQDKVEKEENLIFVAGATGRVGSRTVRELLKIGFRVKAAVRSAERAATLVQSVQRMKLDIGTADVERLEIVECDLEKRKQIEPALGNASAVICCIGAGEKEIFDVTGPYRIDYLATKHLIDAATVAKVNHFILVTSLGTNKFGLPAAILNLFWGVLIWKRKAEEALLASGIPYTIVRPGGMERPTDAYKETHNLTLSKEDTLFGGQVSSLQVAELMAFMAKNRQLSYCKVVEVIAETTVPLTPMAELLAKIPSQRADTYATKASETTKLPDLQRNVSVSTAAEEKLVEAKPSISRPLSPYIAYDDLKPPTSPCPTPSSSKGPHFSASKEINAVSSSGGNNVVIKAAASTVAQTETPQALTFMQSPYYVYEDLKPPTSPYPSVPFVTLPATSSINAASTTGKSEAAESPGVDKSRDEQHHAAPKPCPLSPFTMYEELKPPTSPTPTKC